MFFFRDFAIAVGVGTILLLLLSRLIGRVQFSLSTAFWCSFIGHVFLSIIGLITGFIFSSQLGVALLFGLAIGCFLQAVLFQIAVRATNETLPRFRAVILSLIVISGDFFVASPIIEFRAQILNYLVSLPNKNKVCLLVAIGLTLIYAALKPLSDGLLDTSLWVAKILAPEGVEDNETTKQFLKVSQASFMEGWLSNIPFITTIVFFSSLVVAFLYHWWAAPVVFVVSITLSVFTKLFWGRSCSHYLSFLHHKMLNRTADYKRDNDVQRSEAAESCCKDLEQIMSIYYGARLRPPTPKQLKDIPYGDLYYWLDREGGRA